jgi:arylsulfatase A-like enzyme
MPVHYHFFMIDWLRTLLVLTLLAGGCIVLGCGGDRHWPQQPNVVFVSVDTLRADALGTYGSPVPTPVIDRLGREGVVFEQAYAPVPFTAPTHATLFTGLEPLRHGLDYNGQRLITGPATLAERFAEGGYATAAFVSSFVLERRFGWDRGFEHFDDDFPEEGASWDTSLPGFWHLHHLQGFDRPAATTTDAAAAWLETVEEPFFLFVHYFDPHGPYRPPASFDSRVAGDAVALAGRSVSGTSASALRELLRLYHGEVLYVDFELGRLLEAVERRTSRPPLVLVTADHGEGLGQHNLIGHNANLYDELLRVPLIFHWPAVLEPARVMGSVGLADVAPTLVDLAGLPPLVGADGASLATVLDGHGEQTARPLYAHRQADPKASRDPHLHSLRSGRWKYIRAINGDDELYDLQEDPGESRNLHATRPELAGELADQLDLHLTVTLRVHASSLDDEETRRGLEALGYAQ